MELISEKSMSDIESACFDAICRCCLAPSAEMRDLFLKYKINIGTCVLETCIHELISTCTQITMAENDGLPQLVCETCIGEASSAFVFRNQNLRSDKILRTVLAKRLLQQTDETSASNNEIFEVKNANFEKQKPTGERKTHVKDDKKIHSESYKSKVHLPLEKKKSSVKSVALKVTHAHNTRITRLLKAKNDAVLSKSGSKINLNDSPIVFGELKSDAVNSNGLMNPSNAGNIEHEGTPQTKPLNNMKSKISLLKNCTESLQNKEDIGSSITKDIHNGEQQDPISLLIIELKEEILEESSIPDIFDEGDVDSYKSFPKEKKLKNKKPKAKLLRNDKKKNKTVYAPLYEFPDKPQECSVCSKTCATASALVKHRTESHGSKKYQCITCGNGFTTTRGLRIHLRLHTGEKPEICSTCGKAFSDPRTLKSHERIHSGDQPFPCPVCGKRFPARLPLAHHFSTHTGERPHQCQLCDKAYVQAYSLQVHMRTHTGVRPYPCIACGKAFTNNTSLSVHMLTHNGVKNFQCTICGKRMARSGELTVHLRSHSGERPFSCSFCQKAFTNSGALRVHMPTHTGVKNFVCTVCGKRVARAIELQVHMRAHTGERRYTCQHCHKKFSTSSNMRLHERKHTGEKPFVCNECGRGFADSHVLRNHERTHTGERPHVCATCGRAFAQHSSLRTHLNTHHKAARKANVSQSAVKNPKIQQLPDPSGSISQLILQYASPINAKPQITTDTAHIDSYNLNDPVTTLEEYSGPNFRNLASSGSSDNHSNIINTGANAIPLLKTVNLVNENLNSGLVPVTLISTNSSTPITILNTGKIESGMILSESDGHAVMNGNKNQLIKFRKCFESTNQFTYR